MGVHGGPDIVEDGLVFIVDSSNRQSYISGSTDTFNLVGSQTGSLKNDISFDNNTWLFDGTDDYIDCGNITLLNGLNNASWEFWAKSSGGGGYIAGQWGSGTDRQFYVTINPSTGFMQFYINGNIAIRSRTSSGNALPISINTWYHFCFTFDNSLGGNATPIPFVNGVQASTSQFNSPGPLNSSTTNLHIGKRTDLTSSEWLGNIADFKIYNKTLTAAEILSNYNATKNRFI